LTEIRTYAGHTGPVFELRPSPSGRHFLSHGLDDTIRLWDTNDARQIGVFPLCDAVVFSVDGGQVVRAGGDGVVSLLDAATLRELRTFRGHTGPVQCVAVSRDGHHMLTGGDDRTLRLWDLDSGLEVLCEELEFAVTGVDFSPAGDAALFCLSCCSAFEFDVRQGVVRRRLKVAEEDVMNGIAYSPGGRFGIYSGSGTRVIDLSTGKEIDCIGGGAMLWAPRRGLPPNLAFSKDDQWIAAGQFQGVVELWHTRLRETIRRIDTGATWAYCVAFSLNDDALFCATDVSMHLFHFETGAELRRFSPTPSHANVAVFLPDGNSILTGHGALLLDPTGKKALKQRGKYAYHDNVVRLWSDAEESRTR